MLLDIQDADSEESWIKIDNKLKEKIKSEEAENKSWLRTFDVFGLIFDVPFLLEAIAYLERKVTWRFY